ncbi:MAG TPA: acyl-ACP--UDP-N-acetylglucosamine O-acyltransferase [Pirellulales bacterium]
MTVDVSPLASIAPGATLADDVFVGPFCVVGPEAKIGRGTRLLNNVTLMGRVELGEHNTLYPGVVLGGEPQAPRRRQSPDGGVVVGDQNTFREGATVNRGFDPRTPTRIGSHNYLMANSHVGHDCRLGDQIVLAGAVLLGGCVHVEDAAVLSGAVIVHPYATVGAYSFVVGQTRLLHDVPPFTLVDGQPDRVRGLNQVGVQRAKLAPHLVAALSEACRLLFREKFSLDDALSQVAEQFGPATEIERWFEFLRRQRDGKHGRARDRQRMAVTEGAA